MRKVIHDINCPDCGKESSVVVNFGETLSFSEEPKAPRGCYLVEHKGYCGGEWCDNSIYVYASWDWTIMILDER